MKKQDFLLMEKLVNLLIKEKFEFKDISISDYSGLSFTITISKEKKK